MSANATTSPHFSHTRWYRTRPPSAECTWRNETSFSSVAEKSRMGMDTRPNETAPFQMALGMVALLSPAVLDDVVPQQVVFL